MRASPGRCVCALRNRRPAGREQTRGQEDDTQVNLQSLRAILLDLDGTLVDSAPDITTAVNAMMGHFALPGHSEELVRTWVGRGVERLVQRALASSGVAGKIDPGHAHAVFAAAYERNLCDQSRLYQGVAETLAALRADGYKLGCVTNKPGRLAASLLEELGVAGCFSSIAGGDSVDRKKPDPAVLRYVADRLDTPIEACLMVGDSVNDVEAARAAGIEVVCVSYGYNHGVDIREAEPDAVIDNLTELRLLLDPASRSSPDTVSRLSEGDLA